MLDAQEQAQQALMAAKQRPRTAAVPSFQQCLLNAVPPPPRNLRVLVVDSNAASRMSLVQLLQECQYQVQCVKTSKQALQLLNSEESSVCPFDIVIKDHDPSQVNAYRLLHRMAPHLLSKVPVILVSADYEREMVMKCLNLGAVDFLIKPLRRNEVQQIWTRVWWWRRQASVCSGSDEPLSHHMKMEVASSSDGSDETECDNEDEPTSNEGSAPDNGNGSNGNGSNGNGSNGNGNSGNDQGSNGEENTNGASRIELKLRGDAYNCNGSSGNNGNSATKNIHLNWQGSNVGHGDCTTLAERNALVNTAEGKAPPNSEPQGGAFQPHSPEGRKRAASALPYESDARHAGAAAGKRSHADDGRGSKDEENNQRQATAGASGQHHQQYAQQQAGHHHQHYAGHQQAGQTRSGSSGGKGSSPKVASRGRAAAQQVGGSAGGAAGTANASGLGLTNHSTHTLSEDTVFSAGGQQWPLGSKGLATAAAVPQVAGACATSQQQNHRSNPSTGPSKAAAPAPAASGGAAPGPTPSPCPSESAPAPARVSPSSQITAAQVQQQAAAAGAMPHAAYRMMGGWAPQPAPSCQPIQMSVQAPGAFAPPQAYQGFYPSVHPYGPMMGLPPHMLQQLSPQALQALFASAGMAQGRGMEPSPVSSMEQMFNMQGMPMSKEQSQYNQLMLQYMSAQQLQAPPQQLPVHPASVAEWQAQVLASQKAAAPPQQLYFFNHLGHSAAAAQAQAQAAQQQQQLSKEAMAPAHTHHHHHHHAHAHAEPSPKEAQHVHGGPGLAQVHSVHSAGPGGSLERAGSLQAQALQAQSMHSMPRMSMVSEPGKRRALALERYRLKRQKLKFGKTIRYESRKQLAQQRPRVKGQFVKHAPCGTEPSAGVATPEVTTGDEDCAATTKRGYEGQNFEEVDGEDVSRSTENDSRTVDDEEGGGGSGTGTGAGRGGQGPGSGDTKRKVQAQQTGVSSPEEEEEDVVNSLRQLREGPPRHGVMMS